MVNFLRTKPMRYWNDPSVPGPHTSVAVRQHWLPAIGNQRLFGFQSSTLRNEINEIPRLHWPGILELGEPSFSAWQEGSQIYQGQTNYVRPSTPACPCCIITQNSSSKFTSSVSTSLLSFRHPTAAVAVHGWKRHTQATTPETNDWIQLKKIMKFRIRSLF